MMWRSTASRTREPPTGSRKPLWRCPAGRTARSATPTFCACVGGNVISFARALRKGGRVTGIEFDATRCEFLRHNVATAGVPAEILRGDVARATAEEDTDDGFVPS